MKKVILTLGLLYIGYAYGGQIMDAGAELVEGAGPAWERLQEFLEK
jgi:hypothetical protein|tara:strand:- start:495 stop:632 length:138 start_codon:yes stop_codon:yes gene_type:complete